MPTKGSNPKAKPDDPEEYRRFVETARELGADESPDAMDRAFERVITPQKPKDQPAKQKKARKAPDLP